MNLALNLFVRPSWPSLKRFLQLHPGSMMVCWWLMSAGHVTVKKKKIHFLLHEDLHWLNVIFFFSGYKAIDFAFRGQMKASKIASFCSNLICCSAENPVGSWSLEGVDEDGSSMKILGKSFYSVNLVSSCQWWSIFGGGSGRRGPLLYFGFLVARLLSPRSLITQFELTLPVQGEPWPGATHCYNSSNTMKSNATTHAVTHMHAHTHHQLG